MSSCRRTHPLSKTISVNGSKILLDELHVSTGIVGIDLYVRNKRLANTAGFAPGRTGQMATALGAAKARQPRRV